MNRRKLFQGFAAAASGLLVPEPVRSYFFAPYCGWGDEFITLIPPVIWMPPGLIINLKAIEKLTIHQGLG